MDKKRFNWQEIQLTTTWRKWVCDFPENPQKMPSEGGVHINNDGVIQALLEVEEVTVASPHRVVFRPLVEVMSEMFAGPDFPTKEEAMKWCEENVGKFAHQVAAAALSLHALCNGVELKGDVLSPDEKIRLLMKLNKGWTLPTSPVANCPECGLPAKPAAYNDAGEWSLDGWDCDNGCQEIDAPSHFDWPFFVDCYASDKELETLGFLVVGG